VSAAPEMLRAEVETAIRDRRLTTVERLGRDAVVWLAAPPLWSVEAALAAGFPVESVRTFVQVACDAGWCKVRGSLLDYAPADLLFWMPDEVRREVMDLLRDQAVASSVSSGSGPGPLVQDVLRVAERVRGVLAADEVLGGPEAEIPGALRVWANLMTGHRADVQDEVPGALVEYARLTVAERALGAAQDIVAAGEAIAPVLAGAAEQALSRARRLLALGLRRRQDERALGRYLDRPELSDAVARLLNRDAATDSEPAAGEAPSRAAGPTDPPWALHLRGAGGVGKTMLIRYLASGLYAAQRGQSPIRVARVDFDHLSPDYPVRRPVQLLLELADELALHTAASDRADQALSNFRARATRAHEAVSGLREAGTRPLGHDEVARAVDAFGDVLAELGDVLLILDTCEELAKADLGEQAAPAVRAALDIVERLHQRAPSVRVLFAGRRPLPRQSYLVVQPVAGFTVDEARRYLAASTARPLPAGLAMEMIRQSPAVDGPVPAAGTLPDRVSPFDLALYAAWADEDPDLDAAQVSEGSNAYIEGRIIERLDDPLVVRALPVLASAGRCRVTAVAELIGADPAALGRRLAEQEWIDADGDPPTHVAARPALARRLRRYFESDQRRMAFAAANAALASALVTRVGAIPLAEIDVDELIAALRLAAPAEAAGLWDSIAERATEPPGRWGTVLNMTRRILGEWDEEEWPTTPALRAAVVAAHIAASRRDSPAFDARGPWETVRAWAEQHPDPGAGERLLIRATLGLLPYAPDDDSLWTIIDDYISRYFSPAAAVRLSVAAEELSAVSAELSAAAVDAVHRVLEAGVVLEADAISSVERPSPSLWVVAAAFGDPRLRAWACVTRARVVADDNPARARSLLTDAENAAAAGGPEPSWPDWIPPDDLLARVRIERGLIAPPDDLSVLDDWESYASARLDTIDGERLASLCLRIRLRHGVIDAAVAERWEKSDRYAPDRVPTGSAHDLVPPLFVSVAQAWLSAGQPERALAVLDGRRNEAVRTRHDDTTVRHAEAATVAVISRLGLTDRHAFLRRLASQSSPADPETTHQAMRALATIGLPALTMTMHQRYLVKPESWHSRWQSQRSADITALLALTPQVAQWPPPRTSADAADIRADLEELMALFPEPKGTVTAWANAIAAWLAQPAPPPSARSPEPHREVRAVLRMKALAAETFTPAGPVPHRLLAEIAFEEGRLMALRFPDAAVRLLRISATAYAAAGDLLGLLLAHLAIVGSTLSGSRADISRRAAETALDRLGRANPVLHGLLTGPPDEAGQWRYWATAVRDMAAPRRERVPDDVTPIVDVFHVERAVRSEPVDVTPSSETVPPPVPVSGLPDDATPSLETVPAAEGSKTPSHETTLTFTGDSQPPAPGSPAPRRQRKPLRTFPAMLAIAAACICAGLLVIHVQLGTQAHNAQAGPTVTAGGAPTSTVTQTPTGAPTSIGPTRTAGSSATPATGSASGASAELWFTLLAAFIAVLAALAALLVWYVPRIRQLARQRGIGASPLGTLQFDVMLGGAPTNGRRKREVRLMVSPQPWRTARPRVRLVLALRFPAFWLATRLPVGSGEAGYRGVALIADSPTGTSLVDWTDPRPAGSAAWWRRGRRTAAGIIRAGSEHFPAPPFELLERRLVASLSPAAAGRIEWIRLVGRPGDAAFAIRSEPAELLAPSAWVRAIGHYYTKPAGPHPSTGLLHVIGRAIDTSAGPVMDVTGETTTETSSRQLFDATALAATQADTVILQAEPVPGDTIGSGPPDDQAEKLLLAADLAADGVGAVLLLPVLPAGTTAEVARILTAHIGRRAADGPQVLLTRLRTLIAPHVPAPVLDDVVLFLNAANYRS
jgi:hypothetical protein